jgi:hypothetical protein
MPLQRRGIKDKKLSETIYAKHMETHLEAGMDAVAKLNANWDKVSRKLTSEW